MNEYNLKVTNFTCEACEKVADMVLKRMEDVVDVDVKRDGSVRINAARPMDIQLAIKALKEKGYDAVTA